MKKKELDIPEHILRVIRSDMQSYLAHGYSFAAFMDRNTNGRKYGNELKKIWKEEENAHILR